MKIRRIVSLTLFLCLFLVLVTSVILYIVPQGRVAYWAEWTLWGLSKTQWANLHLNLGLLMIIAGGFHVYYNWKPITTYLKDKAREFRLFTPNFNVALLAVLLFGFGTWLELPPFRWVVDLGEHFSYTAAETLGEPPYGHAEESSLKVFMRNVGIDPAVARANLAAAGIEVDDSERSILDIAHQNDLSPQQLYEKMLGPEDERPTDARPIPESMPKGAGRKTLTEFCSEYRRDLDQAVTILETAGLTIDPQLSLKDIAEANGMEALDLLDLLRRGFGEPVEATAR